MKCADIKDYSTHTQNIVLSILLSHDGMAYSMFDKNENNYFQLRSLTYSDSGDYINEMERFLHDEQLTKRSYNAVNIVVATPRQTIVPEAIFDENKYVNYWNVNFMPLDNEQVMFQHLPDSSNVILFGIDNMLKIKLLTLFPQAAILPAAMPFVETNFTKNKISENCNTPKMFVQVFENHIDTLVLCESKIVLFNSFTYRTNNDLLYFVVNIFEQLKLPQNSTELVFSGFIDVDSLVIVNLRKFIKILYFNAQNNDYRYFYKFQDIMPHYFYNFLNIN